MPESGNALADHFHAAVSAVEARWRQLSVRPQRLSRTELAAYRARDPAMGWRFPVSFSDQVRRLDIIVTANFPFSPARIALVDRAPFLTWPHIESDGVLCLLQDHSTVSIDEPDGPIGVLLGLAFDLIERCIAGGFEHEFRAEFRSYWMHSAKASERPALSLLTPCSPSRLIKVWDGRKQSVIADTDTGLNAWLKNRHPNLTRPERRLKDGVLLWIDQALVPAEFPKTAREIHELAVRSGSAHLLDEIAKKAPDRIFVAIGAATEHGPAIVGTEVKRPRIVRSSDPLTRGFRSSRVPEPIFTSRYFGVQAAGRNSVDRVDPGWIHGRDHDARVTTLRNATVAILGCGSVGAPVALALARAGVGKLILIDKGTLEGANLGRHPLGSEYVGRPKAIGLAHQIRKDLPHLKIDSHFASVQSVLMQPNSPLQFVDLIVSALGDWSSESMLDEWHAENSGTLPIVYGWTEPYAAAGHAVIVVPPHSRFRDGVGPDGKPNVEATQWAAETRKFEPACGAAFEPYGPVELGYITSLVSEAALDCLLGTIGNATHRLWLGRKRTLEAAGGQWTPIIRHIAPHALDGGTVLERVWGQLPTAKASAA